MLAHILGSGSTSRLYRALVVEQHVAINAGAFYQGSSLDDIALRRLCDAAARRHVQAAEAAIDDVIADVVKNGVTAEELDRAKTRMIADAVYAQDNQATLARWYGVALDHRLDGRGRAGLARPHPRGDRRAVRDAARTWLDRRRSVTGYLVKELPEEKRS